MKAIGSMLPWAVSLAVAGVMIGWMLARDVTAGKWLLGGLLFAHGAVHFLYAAPGPDANGAGWPFDMTRSWMIAGPGFSPSLVRSVGWALIVVTAAGFAAAALSAVGVVIPAGWWEPAVIGGAAVSTLTLVLFFDPQLVLGVGINAVLLWMVSVNWWAPA
jgi:hypothetical protein